MLFRNVSGPKIQGSDTDLEIWVSDFTYRLLEKVVRPVISGQKIRIALGDFLEVFIVNGKNPDIITLAVSENQEKSGLGRQKFFLYMCRKRKS